MRRLLSLLILLSAGVCSGTTQPVVVAIDTSRSLSAGDLHKVSERLSRDIQALPAKIPVGLIAFDDTARWITEATLDRKSLTRSLEGLEPQGRFTVLNDALFLAARKLDQGGIIVLVSDGKDENSALEVQDVQQICRENHVAILAMASGRHLDERALRRLSMLSGGRFLGGLEEIESGDFAAGIDQIMASQQEFDTSPPPSRKLEPSPVPSGETSSEPGPTPAPGSRPRHLNWLFPIGALILALGFLAWFWSRKKQSTEEICPHCGNSIENGACLNCEIEAVEEAARTNKVAASAIPGPSSLDPETLARDTLPGNVGRTMTLGEVAVLAVREEGAPERAYSLPQNRIFAVGRAPGVNTLVMEDPTVSSQHFKIVFRDGAYYVVDLGTTNGTLVNSERIRVRCLSPGDTIRAGLTDFIFSYYGETLP